MKALLVGDHAVAHAVALEVAKSGEVYPIMFNANPGMAMISQKYFNLEKANPVLGTLWGIFEGVDFSIIVSRTYIALGIVDELEKAEIPVVGPTKASSRIEWDKFFAKEILERVGIPTPEYRLVKGKEDFSKSLKDLGENVVIKPRYYTRGKGTVHYSRRERFLERLRESLSSHGAVVEKYVKGRNFYVQAFTDGKRISVMPPVAVYRVYDLKFSPGYASYSTGEELPFLTSSDMEKVKSYLQGVVDELRKMGIPFKGVIGVDAIKTVGDVYVLGFSSSFGDPGTINVLPTLKTEFMEVMWSILDENLKSSSFRVEKTFVKFFFPEGYPEKKVRGSKISLNLKCLWNNGVKIFYNRVKMVNGELYAIQSRAFSLFTKANTIQEGEKVIDSVYEAGCVKGVKTITGLVDKGF